MITLEQIRAARAMLGLKQHELAKRAKISMGTLNNIERGFQTDPKISTLRAIQKALEAAGIEFINQQSGSLGIQLKAPQNPNAEPTVLIIDDSDTDRKIYKAWLTKTPGKAYKVIEADNAKIGYDSFIQNAPDCIILDFMMYGKDGFQLLVEMKKERAEIPPIIFMTALPSETMKKDAFDMGVHAYLDKKKLTREILLETVAKALPQHA